MQLVYKYGVATSVTRKENGRVFKRPYEMPESVMDQLWLGHRVREVLVDIEYQYERDVEEAWCNASLEIAEATFRLGQAEAAITDAIKAIRSERASRRTATVQESTAEILKSARAEAKAQRERIKTAKSDKKTVAAAKIGINAADKDRQASYKLLYQRYCTKGIYPSLCDNCWSPEITVDQETGVCSNCEYQWTQRKLYWATFNKILAQHKVAVDRVIKARAQGRRAQLRHHRFTGTGRIAVQLQREHGDKCRCGTCVSRELGVWRVVQFEGNDLAPTSGYTVSRRETSKPRGAAIDPVTVATLEQAAAILANAAKVPVAAVNLAQGKLTKPRDGSAPYTPWTASVVDAALVGLPGPSDPPRSPELLASGAGKWRNVLAITPWMEPAEHEVLAKGSRRRELVEGTATMKVGDTMVEIPVVLDRMMPAEADVSEAQLVVRRVAEKTYMHLCVTISIPDPEPRRDGPTVAVHTGWRLLADGSVRVATWAASSPITVPATVFAATSPGKTEPLIRVRDNGRSGEVVMPAGWMDRAGKPPSIQSIRQQNFNTVQEKLASWLDEHGPLPPYRRFPELTGATLRQWHSIDRFAGLVQRLERETPPIVAGMMPELVGWLRGDSPQNHGDRHLWQYATHEADQLIGRRDDAWRVVAACFAEQSSQVLVDDVDLASLRKKPDDAATEDDLTLPGPVQDKIRARAQLASPGNLRAAIVSAASRRSLPVTKMSVVKLGRTCSQCGWEMGSGDPRIIASAVVTCDRCGASWDQDLATARGMLAGVAASK